MEYYTQPPAPDLTAERRRFSRIGLSLFVFMLVFNVAALVLQLLYFRLVPSETVPPWLNWTVTVIALYGCAAPLMYLLLCGIPAAPPARRRLSAKSFFIFLLIAFALLIAGSMVGQLVNDFISRWFRPQSSGITEALQDSTFWLSCVYTVLVAPAFEELVFRKLLIDRMGGAGDGVIVFSSGIIFGLFHGNFDQFFYAALLGALLAYVYLNTGRILYCIGIHAIINFFGGILPTAMERLFPTSTLMAMVSVLPTYLLAFVGAIFFIIYIRRLLSSLRPGTIPRGRRFSTVAGNVGVILFAVVCAAEFLLTIFLG